MSIISGINDFFGLDIGTSSVRAVQLRSGGKGNPKVLVRQAYAPIDPKLAMSDARADQQKVMQIVRKMLDDNGFTTPNVAVNLPSHRVFTAVVDMERLSHKELAKTIQYQADSLIPTPLAESKLDWTLLGDSPVDKSKVEVLITSVTNEFAEQRLDILESVGLNVIAFEPDGMALSRSVVPAGLPNAVLILDIGSKATDLVILLNDAPRLMRSIPTGYESLVRAAVQNLSISEEQAHQFVSKFGLVSNKLEGQVRNAIIGVVDLLMSEIEKSIKFFNNRYQNVSFDRIVVTGGASALPEFPLYVAGKFNINVEIGNAWRNVTFPADKQNDLIAVSNFFSVAVGLAERNE